MAGNDIYSLGNTLSGWKVSSDFVEAPGLLPDLYLGPSVDQATFRLGGLPMNTITNIATEGLFGLLGFAPGLTPPQSVGGSLGSATIYRFKISHTPHPHI